MDPELNKELHIKVSSWKKELGKIVYNWNLLPGASTNQFDKLVDKLISHLTNGSTTDKIKDVLLSELMVRYGLDVSEESCYEYSLELNEWWEEKTT